MSTYVREPGDWKEKWVNFSYDECKCSCCGLVDVSSDLLDLLQEARNILGPLQLTSFYRCPSHNDSVSSTGLSGPHNTGKSCDIHVSNSQHRKLLIDYFTDKVSGLGISKYFIHTDIISPEELLHRNSCCLY